MLKRNAQFVETVFLKWHLVIYHVGGSQNRSCNKKLLKTYPPLPPRSFCLSGSRPSAISRASFGFSGNLELRTTVLYDLCFNACHVSPSKDQWTEDKINSKVRVQQIQTQTLTESINFLNIVEAIAANSNKHHYKEKKEQKNKKG